MPYTPPHICVARPPSFSPFLFPFSRFLSPFSSSPSPSLFHLQRTELGYASSPWFLSLTDRCGTLGPLVDEALQATAAISGGSFPAQAKPDISDSTGGLGVGVGSGGRPLGRTGATLPLPFSPTMKLSSLPRSTSSHSLSAVLGAVLGCT